MTAWVRTGSGRAARGLLVLAAVMLTAASPVVSILPRPAHLALGKGRIRIDAGTRIAVPAGDAGAMNAARRAVEMVARTRGLSLTVVEDGQGMIHFVRSRQAPTDDEGYRVDVRPAGIWIEANSDAGLFYGAMSLAQLLTPDAQFGMGVTVR
jgi:hexosaminidase